MKERRTWERAAHSVKSWMTKLAGSNVSQQQNQSEQQRHSPTKSLESEGKRLLNMLRQLVAQNQIAVLPSQFAVAVPEALVEAPPGEQQQPKKRALLFSAADLQGISLQKKKKKETEKEATIQQQKSSGKKTGRPFSALDLSSVRLRGTIGTKAVAPPPPAGAGPTPLHEQLKRALQSKFFKVRATPSAAANAAPEQDDVDEWQ